MRQAHPLSLTAMALLMAGVSPPVLAQPSAPTLPVAQSPASSHSVFNPAAPTLALQHQRLAASAAIVAQPGDWKAANAADSDCHQHEGHCTACGICHSTLANPELLTLHSNLPLAAQPAHGAVRFASAAPSELVKPPISAL